MQEGSCSACGTRMRHLCSIERTETYLILNIIWCLYKYCWDLSPNERWYGHELRIAARIFMIFHTIFYNFLCFLCILCIKMGYKKKKTHFSCCILIKNICKNINILYILFINIVYSFDSIHFLSVLPPKEEGKVWHNIIHIYYITIILRHE